MATSRRRAERPKTMTIIPHVLLFRRQDGSWTASRESTGISAEGDTKEEALFALVSDNADDLGLDLTVIDDSEHRVVIRRTNIDDPGGNYFAGYDTYGGGRQAKWRQEHEAQEMRLEEALQIAESIRYARPQIEDVE